MKKHWRIMTLVLVLAMLFTATAAFAAVDDTGFSDVSDSAWYSSAVVYCRDNALMSGTGAQAFSPDARMTRAMLATVLYNAAGRPAVSGDDGFSDTDPSAYYGSAVLLASQNGVISGYGGGIFGTNDNVTREQIASILWRYEGRPSAVGTAAFADSADISPYAAPAVAWARSEGIISGMDGNRFAPKDSATRAQVAMILMNYLEGAPAQPPAPSGSGKTLVAYFSATGNTEAIAEHLVSVLSADSFEIVPQVPYTSADLNYNDASSRVSAERADPAARPAISGSIENLADYDVIFLGYPIWWGQAPRIMTTFLESYDLSGKTIVPFCTSGSSGIGSSAAALAALEPSAVWLDGARFSASATRESLAAWVDTLNLPAQEVLAMTMTVTQNGNTIVFSLNDSPAARSLYNQLPLTVSIENYSDNEKIFYPPEALDTADTPTAAGGAGTVAYYAPWGDVVLFYGAFSANNSLYSLGSATQGAEYISTLSGSVTFEKG